MASYEDDDDEMMADFLRTGDGVDQADNEKEDERVRVALTTKMEKYKLPSESPVDVPLKLDRDGLSEVVRHLLVASGVEDIAKAEQPVIFEFCYYPSEEKKIKGEEGVILRGSLGDFLESKSLSSEQVMNLEYSLAFSPPEGASATAEADDWVASVSATLDDVLVAGTFDGSIRALSYDGTTSFTDIAEKTSAHGGAVKSVCVARDGSQRIAAFSGGKDGIVRAWRIENQSVRCIAECKGHDKSVECVAVRARGDAAKVVSSGWDKTIALWNVPLGTEEPATSPGKRQRVGSEEGAAASASSSVSAIEPTLALSGHTDAVLAVCWGGTRTVYSGSADRTIRSWDMERGIATATIYSKRVVNSLAFSSKRELIASAHPDNCVRVWDARAGGDTHMKLKLDVGSWVTDVKWSPKSEHVLVSASHDGVLRFWDTRGGACIGTVAAHGDEKAFSVAWSSRGTVFSGGADNKICARAI